MPLLTCPFVEGSQFQKHGAYRCYQDHTMVGLFDKIVSKC